MTESGPAADSALRERLGTCRIGRVWTLDLDKKLERNFTINLG